MKKIFNISKETIKNATKKLAIGAMTAAMLGAGTMSGVSATEYVGSYKVLSDSSISMQRASAKTQSASCVACYVHSECTYKDYRGANYYLRGGQTLMGYSGTSFAISGTNKMVIIRSDHRGAVNGKQTSLFHTSSTY